jgi:hypothetical protein
MLVFLTHIGTLLHEDGFIWKRKNPLFCTITWQKETKQKNKQQSTKHYIEN